MKRRGREGWKRRGREGRGEWKEREKVMVKTQEVRDNRVTESHAELQQ